MKKCILVVSMHRSGTSAITGVLSNMGIKAGSNLISGGDENKKGFFENKSILYFNKNVLKSLNSSWDDICWYKEKISQDKINIYTSKLVDIIKEQYFMYDLFTIKDPRICFLFPIYQGAFERLKIDLNIIHTVRHPFETAQSLSNRNNFTFEKGLLLWCQHMIHAEAYSRGYKRSIVFYDNLISEPSKEIMKLINDLSLANVVNVDDLNNSINFIDKKLKHFYKINIKKSNVSFFSESLYEIFKKIKNENDFKLLDNVEDSLQHLIMDYSSKILMVESELNSLNKRYNINYNGNNIVQVISTLKNKLDINTDKLERNNLLIDAVLWDDNKIEPLKTANNESINILFEFVNILNVASKNKVLIYGCNSFSYLLSQWFPKALFLGFVDPENKRKTFFDKPVLKNDKVSLINRVNIIVSEPYTKEQLIEYFHAYGMTNVAVFELYFFKNLLKINKFIKIEKIILKAKRYDLDMVFFRILRLFLLKIINLSNKGNVAIYGAGSLGCFIHYFLSDKVTCFVDNEPMLYNTKYRGKKIISPKQFCLNNASNILITVLGREDDVTENLIKLGCPPGNIKKLILLPKESLLEFSNKFSLISELFEKYNLDKSRKIEKKIYNWQPAKNIEKQIYKFKQFRKTNKSPKVVIYTAIYGKYNTLTLPDILELDIDYVCFTDSSVNSFNVWNIRTSPYFHPDPTRMARYVKTHPGSLLSDYDVAVWIDANIIIRGRIRNYLNIIEQDDFEIAFIAHPLRRCVYEEAEACKSLNKDDENIINRQMSYYKKRNFPENFGMTETNFFITKINNSKIQMFFDIWWDMINNYSKRDQLSVGWAILHSKIKTSLVMPEGMSIRSNSDFSIYSHEVTKLFSEPMQLKKFRFIPYTPKSKEISNCNNETIERHIYTIDIIICIHNALDDVKRCLESVINNLNERERIVLINDKSNIETTNYLRIFSKKYKRTFLVENCKNIGYTKSANIGLKLSTSDFMILLNSDTVVTKDWAKKMLKIAYSRSNIGIVGPLSNAAGSQSIPFIKGTKGQTVINKLPVNLTYDALNVLCEKMSVNDVFPVVPLVHGFCFGIKKSVIEQVGVFDDYNFERYYGEENDYCLRAQKSGFEFAIATNTFIYHRKSRSIQEEERIIHMEKAGKRLRELYGKENIIIACQQIANHPLLITLRRNFSRLYKKNNLT